MSSETTTPGATRQYPGWPISHVLSYMYYHISDSVDSYKREQNKKFEYAFRGIP